MRTCVYAECALSVGLCVCEFGGSLSVWVLEGVWDVSFLLTSLSPWRSWIYVSLVSAAAPKAHTNFHSHTNIYTHTLTPQRLRTGCRKLSSTSLEGRPLVKELPEGVCVLKFFGGAPEVSWSFVFRAITMTDCLLRGADYSCTLHCC